MTLVRDHFDAGLRRPILSAWNKTLRRIDRMLHRCNTAMAKTKQCVGLAGLLATTSLSLPHCARKERPVQQEFPASIAEGPDAVSLVATRLIRLHPVASGFAGALFRATMPRLRPWCSAALSGHFLPYSCCITRSSQTSGPFAWVEIFRLHRHRVGSVRLREVQPANSEHLQHAPAATGLWPVV